MHEDKILTVIKRENMTRYIIVALLLTTSLLAQTFNVSTTPELRTVLTIAIQNVLAGV